MVDKKVKQKNKKTKNKPFSSQIIGWFFYLKGGGELVDNLALPREVALFFEIFKNSVLFTPRSCRKFKPEALAEWIAHHIYLQLEIAYVSN